MDLYFSVSSRSNTLLALSDSNNGASENNFTNDVATVSFPPVITLTIESANRKSMMANNKDAMAYKY